MKERAVEMVEHGPETCKGNQSGKTIDGIWTTPGLTPISADHTEHTEEFDHGMVWLHFEEHEMFGHNRTNQSPSK